MKEGIFDVEMNYFGFLLGAVARFVLLQAFL